MTRVLLADPDPFSSLGLQTALEKRGLHVEVVSDGHLALTRIQLVMHDVCALDSQMHGMDTLTILRRARAAGATVPVAVIGGAATSADRLTWFDAGADDVIAKPFNPDELAARLKSFIRGRRGATESIGCGPLTLDVLSGTVLLGGSVLDLTPREHAFVKVLLARPGYLVPKDRVMRAVFGFDAGVGAVDVLVYRIRRKLQGCGVAIATVRGMGYLLKQVEPSGAAVSA